MKLPMLRGALGVFFWPSYTKRISEDHHNYLNSPEARMRSRSEEPWPRKQITNLRSAWLSALAMVFLVLVCSSFLGIVLAKYLGQDYKSVQAFMQFFGAGLLLWATLAQGGWSVQSMDGNTFAENLSEWGYRLIHVLGTASLVAGTIWSVSNVSS